MAEEQRSVDDPTNLIQQKIEDLNNKHFQWKERKVRSTDDPWITDKIRRAIKRRNRAYEKNKKKRGDRWKIFKRHTNELISEEKLKYYEHEEKKLQVFNPKAVPYKIVKDLTEPERPQPWTIQNMRPGKSDEDIVEELSVFFSQINNLLPPLPPPVNQSRALLTHHPTIRGP